MSCTFIDIDSYTVNALAQLAEKNYVARCEAWAEEYAQDVVKRRNNSWWRKLFRCKPVTRADIQAELDATPPDFLSVHWTYHMRKMYQYDKEWKLFRDLQQLCSTNVPLIHLSLADHAKLVAWAR